MAGDPALRGFENLDDIAVYGKFENAVIDPVTRNFVIEFNESKAYAALNFEEPFLERFLPIKASPSQPPTPVRDGYWEAELNTSNIWAPDKQTPLIKRLAAEYKFSPRLAGIMHSKHSTPSIVPQKPMHKDLRQRVGFNPFNATILERKSTDTHSADLEKDEKGLPVLARFPMLDLNHYKMVNEVWHYYSVDWGTNYLCIGYNSISDTDGNQELSSEDVQDTSGTLEDNAETAKRSGNNPHGARAWTWLVLTDDGTIISMYEDPFPGHQGVLSEKQKARVARMRRNLFNVFTQLSNVNDIRRRADPIHTLDIRPGLDANQSSDIRIAESPSLLLYYLFDDWYTSYALVAKEEHQYARLLEKLRLDMFEKPQLGLIQQMHQYGRQLAVLKRMYQSYALIIQRILDRQKPVNLLSGDSHSIGHSHASQLSRESNMTIRMTDEGESTVDTKTFGAPLSAAATVRFERLRDRINHYAISEIQECLDEKEALVFLNFNLITLKESHAVERLTRITILLAKVTILFMPVSLMTGYFSTQIPDLQDTYTAKTYWSCFGVIMFLSIIFLLIFGVLSGTLEGKPIYRSLTETVIDLGRGKWRKRKGKKGR